MRPAPRERIIRDNWQQPKKSTTKAPSIWSPRWIENPSGSIVDVLRRNFPDHSILAEEETDVDGAQSHYRWIVDPLDGTTNFAHSYPQFCVSIALEYERRESSSDWSTIRSDNECFKAVRGRGRNTQRQPDSELRRRMNWTNRLLATGFPYDHRDFADFYLSLLQSVPDPLPRNPPRRLGSARSLLRRLRQARWVSGN